MKFPAVIISTVVTLLLTSCSVGAPGALVTPDPVQSQERVVRGVVNGLWKYDTAENVKRLTAWSVSASASEAAGYADRHQVRVGIDIGPVLTKFVEVVPLPRGWTYSLDKVVDDGRTINVGDIVDIRTVIGGHVIPLVEIVRKCNHAPVAGENPDWLIGCKSYGSFKPNGYAGEVLGF